MTVAGGAAHGILQESGRSACTYGYMATVVSLV